MENEKEIWRECPDCGAHYLMRPRKGQTDAPTAAATSS